MGNFIKENGVMIFWLTLIIVLGGLFIWWVIENPEYLPKRPTIQANSVNERKCINACNRNDGFVTKDSFVYEGGIGQNHCICVGNGVTNLW